MKRKNFIDVLSLKPVRSFVDGPCILVTFVDEKGILHRRNFPFYKVHFCSALSTNSYFLKGLLYDSLFLNELDTDHLLTLLREPFEVKKPSLLKFLGL